MSGELTEKFSPYVLGIDLGTSTSIVSIYKHGRPEVLAVAGEKVTPSVVNYREGAEPLIGVQAKRRAIIDPDSTIVSIKRHMGDSNYKREVNGKPIKPEEVSALILEHLKNGAQDHLDGTARYAIITIPANFENNQRQATLEAGRLAGLEVLRLVEEPVAAAMAYGFGHERDQTILVYDLGGGTFDVCILRVEASPDGTARFSVLGKAGIPQLGGDDFDEVIMRMLAEEIIKAGGPDVLDLKKDQGISKKKLRAACQILKEKAEAAKIELSEAESAFVDVPSLVKSEDGREFHLSTEITRPRFGAAIAPLVAQTAECIHQALQEAGLQVDDVDRIILVGGSTRVPFIRTMVTEIFGKEPYGDIDPTTAVSRGAGILGATFELPGEKPPEDKVETDTFKEVNRTSHYLGIETQGQRFSKILSKNVEFPIANNKIYTTTFDNQTELRITIFQFPEETDFIDMKIAGSACLGEFHLGPLDAAPRGTVPINVTFEIDPNGMLKVQAESESKPGLKKELEIRVV